MASQSQAHEVVETAQEIGGQLVDSTRQLATGLVENTRKSYESNPTLTVAIGAATAVAIGVLVTLIVRRN